MNKLISYFFDFRRSKSYWESNSEILPIVFSNPEEKNKFLNFAFFKNRKLNLDELISNYILYNKNLKTEIENKEYNKFRKIYKKQGISDRIANAHLEYLKFLYQEEKKRQDKIDQKGQILIYQSSILVGIISIIVQFFFDKSPEFNTIHFYAFFISFIPIPLIIFYLIKSVRYGIKSNDLQGYQRPPEGLFLTHWKDDINDFVTSYSNQIYFALKTNINNTDIKGEFIRIGIKNLHRGLILISFIAVVFSFNLLFNKKINVTHNIKIINESIKVYTNEK